jgi:hypothetical protein
MTLTTINSKQVRTAVLQIFPYSSNLNHSLEAFKTTEPLKLELQY